MSTVSNKEMRAAVKANKELLDLKATAVNLAKEEQIEVWYAELLTNEKFVPAPSPAERLVNNTPIEGEYLAENGARLIKLAYIGRSNSGQFKFEYGQSFVTTNVNALRVLAATNKLNVGDLFTFKADTIVFNAKYKCFDGLVNVTNDEIISAGMNEAKANKIAMDDKIALMKSKGAKQKDIDNALADAVKDELKTIFKF